LQTDCKPPLLFRLRDDPGDALRGSGECGSVRVELGSPGSDLIALPVEEVDHLPSRVQIAFFGGRLVPN
jgi:hypothetical protein